MFDGGIILFLMIVVLVLAVLVFLLGRKKNKEKRCFTEDDRQAILLIRELDQIISEVKEAVK